MAGNSYHRRRSVVWPVVLISLGLIFLLNNLGVISWNIWSAMLRMWPLLLVAVGIDLIFGRRSGVGAAIAAILIVGMFAGAFFLVDLAGTPWSGDQVTETISQSFGEAERAAVDVSINVGELHLSALLGSSELLIEGEIQVGENETITDQLRMVGSTAEYKLATHGHSYNPGWIFSTEGNQDKRWDLRLSGNIPIDLDLDSGVGRAVLDLSGLNLASLNIDSGVGEVIVTLPESGDYTVRVDGGVGALEVLIPAGVEAKVVLDTGLGNSTIIGDLTYQNGEYYTPGYDSADERVEVHVDSGVGSIKIVLQD